MDELIVELKIDEHLHDRVMEAVGLMETSMQKYIPDVRIVAEPALMHRWHKEAEPVYTDDDRLTIWTPELKVEKRDNGRLYVVKEENR